MEKRGRSNATGYGTGNLEMIGIYSKRDGGQQQYFGAALGSIFARFSTNDVYFQIIRAVGHVEIVRLGSPKGEDGGFPLRGPNRRMRHFRKNVIAHELLSNRGIYKDSAHEK